MLNVRLANEFDDAALRLIMRIMYMDGDVQLAFTREPQFFTAERSGNRVTQTGVLEKDHVVVGMGTRAVRTAYISGYPSAVGYLGSLRILGPYQKSLALFTGYQFLRTLHTAAADVPFYFTTILDENTVARAVLTSGRANLPIYEQLAGISTYLIPVNRKFPFDPSGHIHSAPELTDAVHCLNTYNAAYQGAPYYEVNDFVTGSSILPEFSWAHMYSYEHNYVVQGTLGVWNQSGFKQTVVHGYSPTMARVRYVYNLWALIRGLPLLPVLNSEIRYVYAAFVSVPDNDPEIFLDLLMTALHDWSGKGHDYLLIGFCDGHPLNQIVKPFALRVLHSSLYGVYWGDRPDNLPDSKNQFHVEIATL